MMAKHSALNRANGVRFPADPRDPGSANGRPLRSERRCRQRVNVGGLRPPKFFAGGFGNPLRVPEWIDRPRPGTPQLGDRLTAGRQVLTLFVEVRLLVPERLRCATNVISDNRIVDDARGRAPFRSQYCPRSRSGDGACLKRRRCWFDSRRGHNNRGAHVRFRLSSDLGPIGDGYPPVKLCAPPQGGARVDERRFREPEAAGADPAILTQRIARA